MKPLDEVVEFRAALTKYLDQRDATGRVIGDAKRGVYVFYDYDKEPLYVGQTTERVRVRIRRHLTNQRTDAISMGVLNPADVAYIEVWPFHQEMTKDEATRHLSAAEYTVYQRVVAASTVKAVLNEKDIPETPLVELPESVMERVVPLDMFLSNRHPDLCIARKIQSQMALIEVINSRAASPGLRRTLHTQARIIERLCQARATSPSNGPPPFVMDGPTDIFELLGSVQ